MNVSITEHARARALERGGIRTGDRIRRLFNNAVPATPAVIKRLSLHTESLGDGRRKVVRMNQEHIFVADTNGSDYRIVTYLNLENGEYSGRT